MSFSGRNQRRTERPVSNPRMAARLKAPTVDWSSGRITVLLGRTADRKATTMRWLFAAVGLLTAGCSLPGGLLPSAAGPTDEKVGWGMHRIPLRARADCASPDECTLVQAAEATQRAGNTHFMVLPGHGSSIQRGYAYIKVMTIDPGDRAPSGAVSVEEALHFFRHRQDLPSTAAPSAPSPRPHPSPLLTASPPGGRVATSGG